MKRALIRPSTRNLPASCKPARWDVLYELAFGVDGSYFALYKMGSGKGMVNTLLIINPLLLLITVVTLRARTNNYANGLFRYMFFPKLFESLSGLLSVVNRTETL